LLDRAALSRVGELELLDRHPGDLTERSVEWDFPYFMSERGAALSNHFNQKAARLFG
jgi:hypothetical protein